MISTKRMRGMIKALAIALAVAMPVAMAVTSADARMGGGRSFGSRGARTFSPPPMTRTAPSARPFDRTMAPRNAAAPRPNGGGFFNRPGLLGGLAAGFLGAGLFGMLFGGGLFGGLGSLSSLLGLLLQIGLIVLVVRFAMSWWQRRNAAAYAGPTPGPAAGADAAQTSFRNGSGFGLGGNTAPLEIKPEDYDAFERLLGEVEAAWSDGDIARLHTLATPEMVSYLTEDLSADAARGVVNKVTDIKLLQGDLAEAWREGDTDYATVAMRFTLVDRTLDKASGRLVEGSDEPIEVTEIWTFVRSRGAAWELSGVQQA